MAQGWSSCEDTRSSLLALASRRQQRSISCYNLDVAPHGLTDFFEKYWVKMSILNPELVLQINSIDHRYRKGLNNRAPIRSPGKKNVKCVNSTTLNGLNLFSQLAVLCSISWKLIASLFLPTTLNLPSLTLLRSSILSSHGTTLPKFYPPTSFYIFKSLSLTIPSQAKLCSVCTQVKSTITSFHVTRDW